LRDPQTVLRAYSPKWGVADEMALPIGSIAINYIAISITYEFAVLF